MVLLASSAALGQQAAPPPAPAPGDVPAPEAAPPPAPEAAPPPPTAVASPALTAAPPPAEIPAAPVQESWFARPPLSMSVGEPANKWTLTFYGFLQADYIADTTRSYNDAIGSSIVARSDIHEGREGRTLFSTRNTRLGLMFDAPRVGGVKPSAILEGDFFGNQPATPPAGSEREYFDSPTFRLRHAFVKLENGVLDVLAGQTYDVFGWQNFFSPATTQHLGIPNQVFSRNTQLRLSKTINPTGPVSVDVAASAVRPAQRDSRVPDLMAGLRISFGGWKGITTPGNVGTTALPLSIGVSGVVRQFAVNAFTPPPIQNQNHVTGWGVSVDAFLPVIPAANAYDRGNRLTLIGSFVTGTGIADLLTTGGGARFPTLPNPGLVNPPFQYIPNLDEGLVSFDVRGVAHTIDWRAFRGGIQYYFPGSGRLFFSGNFTYAHSKNIALLFPMGGVEIDLITNIADVSWFADGNLFWDWTPSVRVGLSGAWTRVEYIQPNTPYNIRGMGQVLYVF